MLSGDAAVCKCTLWWLELHAEGSICHPVQKPLPLLCGMRVTAASVITEGAPRAVRWLLLDLNSCKQSSKFFLAIAPDACAVSGYSGKTFSRMWGLWPCSPEDVGWASSAFITATAIAFSFKIPLFCPGSSWMFLHMSYSFCDRYTVLSDLEMIVLQ